MCTCLDLSLTMSSPVLHSTLNKNAISLLHIQTDTHPRTDIRIVSFLFFFLSKGTLSELISCLSDVMAVFAKTTVKMTVLSLCLFFKLYLFFRFWSLSSIYILNCICVPDIYVYKLCICLCMLDGEKAVLEPGGDPLGPVYTHDRGSCHYDSSVFHGRTWSYYRRWVDHIFNVYLHCCPFKWKFIWILYVEPP